MAQRLIEKGYSAKVLKGGWKAWSDAGYPSKRSRLKVAPEIREELEQVVEEGLSSDSFP